MSSSSCSRLYLCSLPSLSYLEAFQAEVLNCYTLPAVKAKCRELVRGDPLLLSSPVKAQQFVRNGASVNTVWIVAKMGYITADDNKVQQRLINAKIKVIRKVTTGLELILSCYRFTLTARLAPKWNIIGDWLVKGSEIFETGKGQALKLDVGMTTKEITVYVVALKLIIHFLKPEDLEVSTSLLNQFKKDSNIIIKEVAISNNKCYVLPNFTEAHVFSSAHSIPSSAGFDSYDKIRLYWKKQYGFILPESQNLFYQIYFKFNPGTFFSYPGCCVTTGRPLMCPSRDVDQLTANFINDIHNRMPSLCGQQITFSKKPLTVSNVLQPVTRIGPQPNTKPVLVSRPGIKPVLGRPNLPPIIRGHTQSQTVPDGRNAIPQPLCNDTAVPSYSPHNSINSSSMLPATIIHDSNETIVPSVELNKPQTNTIIPSFNSVSKTNSHRNGVVSSIGNSSIATTIPTSNKRPVPSSLASSLPASKRVCNNGIKRSVSNSHLVPSLEDDNDFENSSTWSNTSFELSSAINTTKKNKTGQSLLPAEHSKIDKNSCTKMLQRTKIADLKIWLKQNKVTYTSKDKKDELVRKVAQHLTETGQTHLKL